MNFLEERIAKDGVVKEGNVLKVDSFLIKSLAGRMLSLFVNQSAVKISIIITSIFRSIVLSASLCFYYFMNFEIEKESCFHRILFLIFVDIFYFMVLILLDLSG